MSNGNGSYVPSQDQIMGQLRILIPAVGSIVSVLGIYSADKTGALVASLLTAVGPISYVIGAGWSLYANTRKSIMLAASNRSMPKPQRRKLSFQKKKPRWPRPFRQTLTQQMM